MVIVDVRPHTVGIPTDAYFAVEEIKYVRLPLPSFPRPCPLTPPRRIGWHRDSQDVPTRASAIEAEEAEDIGVEHLLRDIKDSTQLDYDYACDARLGAARNFCVLYYAVVCMGGITSRRTVGTAMSAVQAPFFIDVLNHVGMSRPNLTHSYSSQERN
jgi:hypothetical protein